MKAVTSILLLLLISSSLFYYGYFDVMLLRSKEKARHSIVAGAHNHSLIIFRVPAANGEKYKSDEVNINGDLYDVGDREIINDTLYMSLYHDSNEQSILSDISDFFKADDANNVAAIPGKPSLKTAHITFNPQYYFEDISLSLKSDADNNINYLTKASLISLHSFAIITPPPQFS